MPRRPRPGVVSVATTPSTLPGAVVLAPPHRLVLTFNDIARALRVSKRRLYEIREADPTFPEAVLMPGGQLPAWIRSEVSAWLRSLPRVPNRRAKKEGPSC